MANQNQNMQLVVPPKQPNLLQKFLLFLSDALPMHGMGRIVGLMDLMVRRVAMEGLNLYRAPLQTTSSEQVPDYRTPTGEGNDKQYYKTGAEMTAFGRNMPPANSFDPDDGPAPQVIAAKLLERRGFKPAGDQLNVLAAAWIQAMAHDWFGHMDSEQDITLDKGTSACPMKAFTFKKTKRRADGAFDNFRTHWWDSSFVYGQDQQDVKRARTFCGGKIHQTNTPGVLPTDDQGIPIVGDMKNGWMGVMLLQDIFVREHNAVADAIVAAHPELADQDEKVFNYARLVVSAVAAKIHTVDWTVELLKTDTLEAGMNTNWYGIFKGLGVPFADGPPGLFSLVARDTDNHGVPYCLTEEFVSVYRLHPLLPDGLLVENDGFVPLLDLVALRGAEKLNRDGAGKDYWNSVIQYPCGNLELHNYARALRDLPPTEDNGVEMVDKNVDLAALDIYRDRERGIRRYNDFRRGLFMKPFKSIAELCGGKDTQTCKELSAVYGEDGIEKIDLQIGLLAEKKIPGFAISETAFNIFLLMASRRLEADRFFTKDFNKETYSDVGFEWVKSVKTMRDVLKRHLPDVEAAIPKGQSAFKPYRVWPEEYLK